MNTKTMIDFIIQCKEKKPLSEIDTRTFTELMVSMRGFSRLYKKTLDDYESKHKKYTYMLTFTVNPAKHDPEDHALQDILTEYITDYAERRNPIRADLVKEGGDTTDKHTHYHLGLLMKKHIDFSNTLKYYRKKYGNVDVSKSWSNDYEKVLIYINKQSPPLRICHNQT